MITFVHHHVQTFFYQEVYLRLQFHQFPIQHPLHHSFLMQQIVGVVLGQPHGFFLSLRLLHNVSLFRLQRYANNGIRRLIKSSKKRQKACLFLPKCRKNKPFVYYQCYNSMSRTLHGAVRDIAWASSHTHV